MKSFHDKLIELNACEEAIQWVGDKTLERAWKECHRGDWMLWLADEIHVNQKLIVKAACTCARLALPHVPAGETRPLIAIETTEKWCEGEATIEEVRKAAEAAYAARAAADAACAAARAAYAAARAAAAADDAAGAVYAAAIDADYAVDAAVDAAYAVDAAVDAAYAAIDADYAVDAVIDAAYAACAYARAAYAVDAAVDARKQCLRECADIVRQIIPVASMR